MLEWMLFRGILVAFFILANSFFVAAEFALVSLRETRVEQLIAHGRPGARTALKLKQNIDEFLPAVQFGVTLAALALGWIGEPAVTEILLRLADRIFPVIPPHFILYAHGLAVLLSFSLITYFEVLLGELVPKSLALQRAERIALAVAGPMDVFIRITQPAVRLMNGSATLVLRLFRAPLRGESESHSPEELKLIATSSRRTGLLSISQEEMIHRAIELNRVTVREIMTPRGKIFSLPADLPLEAASARIIDEQHSRVPVFEPSGGPDQIVGLVYSKDVARLMHFGGVGQRFGAQNSLLILRQIMREAMFVPETKLAVDLLQDFQTRRRHLAIVVDEFGTTVGIVSSEDALEQIVGELDDEFDTAAPSASPNTTGPIVLDGSTTLRDLGTQLGWAFPREPGVETIAGFLLSHLGHIPQPGESLNHHGRRFTVAGMTEHRISQVRVETIYKEVPVPESEGIEVTA